MELESKVRVSRKLISYRGHLRLYEDLYHRKTGGSHGEIILADLDKGTETKITLKKGLATVEALGQEELF